MSGALHVPPLSADRIRGLLALESVPHDDVLTAIGGHYGGGVSLATRSTRHALFGVAGEACDVQARRLVEVLFFHLGLSPDECSADGLILPTVLITRRADPLVISMIGHELARRAGLESHVCIAGEDSWTALLDAENCTLVGLVGVRGLGCLRARIPRRLRARDGHGGPGAPRAARAGRAQRCAGALATAMRSGRRHVPACPGHRPRR